ncbi:MAG TPA: hypothetical protein VGD27_14280 [Longimicrobiales bacterium]
MRNPNRTRQYHRLSLAQRIGFVAAFLILAFVIGQLIAAAFD